MPYTSGRDFEILVLRVLLMLGDKIWTNDRWYRLLLAFKF